MRRSIALTICRSWQRLMGWTWVVLCLGVMPMFMQWCIHRWPWRSVLLCHTDADAVFLSLLSSIVCISEHLLILVLEGGGDHTLADLIRRNYMSCQPQPRLPSIKLSYLIFISLFSLSKSSVPLRVPAKESWYGVKRDPSTQVYRHRLLWQ